MSKDEEKDHGQVRTSRRVECLNPEKTASTSDIYTVEHAANEMHVEVNDESTPDIGATAGFNPYDTAALHKK